MKSEIFPIIQRVIQEVWTQDLKKDYCNNALLKEDSLKNAFYYHLRRRLGDTFLKANNLCIYTEFKLDNGQKIDLVIAEIDFVKAQNSHLKNCIKNLVAVIEFKYTHDLNDNPYLKDINKLMAYMENLPYVNAHYYAAFIREVEYFEGVSPSWIVEEHKKNINNNFTELLANLTNDEMVWEIINH